MTWGEPAKERVRQILPYTSLLDGRHEDKVGRRGWLVHRVRYEEAPQSVHTLVIRWDTSPNYAERGIPPEAVAPVDAVELLGELA